MLALADITLIAPTSKQALTPTQIGKKFGVSARQINQVLMDNRYQVKQGDGYEPTEAGDIFAVMLDTNKWHSDGTPVKQLKWSSDILDELKDLL